MKKSPKILSLSMTRRRTEKPGKEIEVEIIIKNYVATSKKR